MFFTRSQIIKLINILFIVGGCECHQQNKEHMKIMALISTIKVSPVLWRAESVHKITVTNSTPLRLESSRLNSLLCGTVALGNLFPSPELYKGDEHRWRGERGQSDLDTVFHEQDGCPGGHMRPAVPPRSSEAFARCYQRQCGQEQMIATADKWKRPTESVSRAWLLSTAVTRETDVSLMEQASAKTFLLPRFHWSNSHFYGNISCQPATERLHLLVNVRCGSQPVHFWGPGYPQH